MSDPKATKMTLEDAVQITRDPRARYGLDQARAIVDQAVRFVKAYEAASGYGPKSLDDMPMHELEALGDEFVSSYEKLRALERGESEVKP